MKITGKFGSALAVLIMPAAWICPLPAGAADAARPARNTADVNWLTHGGTSSEGNFSPLSEISTANISRLGLAWSLDLDGERSLEATPLAVNGILYFTGSTSDVYAVDAASGHVRWKYDPQISKHMPEHMKYIFAVNRGVAYSQGKVFVGTIDGRLIALDAQTGKPLWTTVTVAEESKQTITGAPWVVKGKVLIGNGGADLGARGYVTAYEANTGKKLWRFFTVPGDPAKNFGAENFEHDAMAMAAKTWGGEWWKVSGGGGTVWDNMTYDPELNRIYIGVGNSGPYDPRVRSPGNGDNLFLASIVAIDADTGKYIWHYQVNPREAWDFKACANMITADLTIGGRPRKVLMQSPTSGFFYVLDRTNGQLISAEKTGKVTWADRIDLNTGRPVETYNIRYDKGPVDIWPGPFGTHNWQGMSFSPKTGLVYIPYMQLGARYSAENAPAGAAGSATESDAAAMGGVSITPLLADKEDGKGALLAWDPVAQKARWKIPYESIWNGGATSTAGGLVFQGTGDGQFLAYDSTSGKRVWAFDAKLGIIASPITYTAGGKQYVSVLVGYGGALGVSSAIFNRGWKFGAQPRRLLTFALDENKSLPPTAPADFTVRALDDPTLVIDDAQVKSGMAIFQVTCSYCHGNNTLSAGSPAPDLRESSVALNWTSFLSVVKQGALAPQGMPRYGELTEDQLRSIYVFIRARSRDALSPGTSKPSEPAATRY